MRTVVVVAGVLALGAVVVGGASGSAVAHPSRDGGEALGGRIEAAIRAGGPFFTAEEQAVIERKCGYPAGSFDGFEVSINDGVLICKGGRRVDDAETRALMAVAGARISRRVEAVMHSPEVRGAIQAVADEAAREALAAIDHAAIAREAGAAAGAAAREAAAGAREAAREARIQARRAEAEARRAH